MAVIASAVVTVNERRIYGSGKKRRNRITITFGDGVNTYPAGGVVLPTFGSFGMTRQLDYVLLVDASNPDGFVYKYDQTNNKLRIYSEQAVALNAPLLEVSAAFVPALNVTLTGEAVGW
jgi:hypothetical protein